MTMWPKLREVLPSCIVYSPHTKQNKEMHTTKFITVQGEVNESPVTFEDLYTPMLEVDTFKACKICKVWGRKGGSAVKGTDQRTQHLHL